MNRPITVFTILWITSIITCYGQKNIPVIRSLIEISDIEPGISNYWLEMGMNTYGSQMLVPVIVIQGEDNGPTLGLTAAIHGDELNGIPIIHKLIEVIDITKLKGRIIAIPGLNAYSIQNDERRFIDDEDLNRNFPGKVNGNRSQQYAFKIKDRILPEFNFLIDMHTASFGRVNTLYARADLSNDTLKTLARLQKPDIILNSKGASAGNNSPTHTMRAEATLMGIPSITVEYGNPQVFQQNLTKRGIEGVFNTLKWLKMYDETLEINFSENTTYCEKSYWIYMDEGGFLEINVDLNQKIKKGDQIAIVRNAFGEIIRLYTAPENGIVIGKSTNPTNMSGGRIIHLGIIE